MTNFKHLSQSELLAYSLGSLEKGVSQRLGKHLLHCVECRKLLPMPSVERFSAIVMTDAETIDVPQKEEAEGFLSSLVSFLKFESVFVLGAGLIIIFSFSFLLWLNSADSSREVVQTFDTESGSEINFPSPSQTPIVENSISSTNLNRAAAVPTPKNTKLVSPKQESSQNNPAQKSQKTSLKKTNETVSSTRGITSKCGENQTIQIEFLSDRENFVFTWKAFPKAVKYHLYISDDEEILIDEFETESETSFKLKKTLDPMKSYKWKIIITLENGQKVVGDSRKFTLKDFQINQKRIETKKSSENRCSEKS